MSLSWRITTFPRSIAAGTPAFWSSPTTGPGLKGVSPARTQRSSGAISPPRAGARVLVASSSLKSRNGLMSAVTTAVWPSIVSLSFTRSGFFSLACCNARRSRLFFATVIVARSESFFRIAWNCGAGIPWMFAIPMTRACAQRVARLSTSCFLYGATCAKGTTSEVLHRGPHRGLHVGGLDVESSAFHLAHDAAHQGVQILGEILRGHVPRPDRRMECPLVAAPHPDRVPQGVDQVRRVRRGRHGTWHPPPRPEDDAESLADHRHERRFRNEEVVRCREGPRLPLVARVLLDLLRLDHEVRGVPRLQGELSRREDADADRLHGYFRQDDVLFDAILRDRKINIAKVHGDLDGLFERTGLGGLEQLLDGLDRMLVRQGRSPPAVRAARWPPAEERRRKSVALIRLCGRATPGPSSANYEQDSTYFHRPSRGIDDPSGVAQELSVGR